MSTEHWLPVWSAWQTKNVSTLHAMHEGLAAAGMTTRLDRLGVPPFACELLWVEVPTPFVEAGERWLHAAIRPMLDRGDDWAEDIDFLLTVRQSWWSVWSGPRSECERMLDGKLRGLKLMHAGADPTALEASPRSVTRCLRHLPETAGQGPDACDRDHEWLPIDQASTEEERAELSAFEVCLRAAGFATCRYDTSHYALLSIDAGTDCFDELELRLAAARERSLDVAWSRYRPWTLRSDRPLVVHRFHDEGQTVWQLREQLEARIGGPVDASRLPNGDESLLRVPPALVERALAALRT